MSKPFFEVFPTLKAGEDICNMFEGAQVLKVTTNSDRTFLSSTYSKSSSDSENIGIRDGAPDQEPAFRKKCRAGRDSRKV